MQRRQQVKGKKMVGSWCLEVKHEKVWEVCTWRAGWGDGQKPDHQGPCMQCQAVISKWNLYFQPKKKKSLRFINI